MTEAAAFYLGRATTNLGLANNLGPKICCGIVNER